VRRHIISLAGSREAFLALPASGRALITNTAMLKHRVEQLSLASIRGDPVTRRA
jgi:hypothetical protein